MTSSYVLALHGGAGTVALDAHTRIPYINALEEAALAGEAVLARGGSALDAVLATVVELENCPLFNAGCGSVYTALGTHEMDASIMDGSTLSAGAVAGVSTVRNPVLLAKAVMEHTSHVLLVGEGAEQFAREQGVAIESADYFATAERMAQLRHTEATSKKSILDHDAASQLAAIQASTHRNEKLGTVGAVARDRKGNLAAATSTGGLTFKRPGRVGDSPIIGAGCYADSGTVAVSTTGTGEHFMRTVLAYDVAARMEYGDFSLLEAAHKAIHGRLSSIGGQGGLIAIDSQGNLAMPFNTAGMYRAWVREGQKVVAEIEAASLN